VIEVELIFRFRIAVLSHPFELNKLLVYVPDANKEMPFHRYGICAGQTLKLVLLVVGLFMVKFKRAIESHPTPFTLLKVLTPELVYVIPFQV
jgi:hypothetical protein